VSILNHLRRNAHLDDDAFVAIWTDASVTGDPPAHPHLQGCAACRSRFVGFSEWLEGIRSEAVAEADAHFPAERLAQQHAQIFRRLEAAERPARVIAFPKFARPIAARGSRLHRWVLTSAAAGLIVGLGLGQMMDFRRLTQPPAAAVRYVESTGSDRSGLPVQTASVMSSDDTLMAEVDASLTRRTPELRAIDELTPRAPFPDPDDRR
jgi:hypothetical protein